MSWQPKEDTVYNQWDNEVMVRTTGDYINIICKKERQVQKVIDRMSTSTCILSDYEEWDEDEDMKWILTFRILDEFDKPPELN
jgi:hypothetical protein